MSFTGVFSIRFTDIETIKTLKMFKLTNESMNFFTGSMTAIIINSLTDIIKIKKGYRLYPFILPFVLTTLYFKPQEYLINDEYNTYKKNNVVKVDTTNGDKMIETSEGFLYKC